MKNSGYWSLVCILAASCSGKEKATSDDFSYSVKKIHVVSSGCAEAGNPCASFDVTYPEFTNLKPEVQEILLEKIQNAVGYDNPETDDFTLQQMGERFVSDFERFQLDFAENTSGWYFKCDFNVLLAKDSILSLSAQSEFFTGGAHGGYTVYYVNINPVTGQRVTLQSVLFPGYEQELNRVGEEAFRLARKLSRETDLAEAGFEFGEGAFSLNDNYGFSENGIVFFFNNYEIAPYVLGPTELFIPWDKLVALRK